MFVYGTQFIYDGVSGEPLVPSANNGPIGGQDLADINGDGKLDLCTRSQTLFTAEGDWHFVSPPNDLDPTSIWRSDYHACLPDLDGDGYGDLLMAHYDNAATSYTSASGGPLTLFAGSPDGYASTPTWSFDELEVAVYSARAVQADNDPELEIALLAGDIGYAFTLVSSSLLIVLDDVATTPTVRNVALFPVSGGSRYGIMPQLLVLGDLDGDGSDEIGLPESLGEVFVPNKPATHHFRIVSTSNPYGSIDTLTTLAFDFATPDYYAGDMMLRAHDLDGDGQLDLYGFTEVASGLTQIQVWYGPLYEPPEPTHTGTTSDTSTTVTPTDDTASAAADTAATTTKSTGPASDEAGGCGCSQPVSYASLFLPLFSRRRGAQ